MDKDNKAEVKLELNIGKPDDGYNSTNNEHKSQAATFSRFVLPFAYNINKTNKTLSETDLFYEIKTLDNLSFIKRHKHFTRETSLTLYQRALWLHMSDDWEKTSWCQEEVRVLLKEKEFTIAMLPPKIVLFEACDSEQKHCLASLYENKQKEHILKTGFLYVDIYFPDQKQIPELDDLLILNEFFRYYGMPYDPHACLFKAKFGNVPVDYGINQKSTRVNDLKPDKVQKFRYYFERWSNLLKIPIKDGDQVYNLFPEAWHTNSENYSYNIDGVNDDKNWQIYADNRTYVWTSAFIEHGGKALQTSFNRGKEKLKAHEYGHWVKLLNVDNPPCDYNTKSYKSATATHSATDFEKSWAQERSYKRWEEDGTFYGYCYHSGASLIAMDICFEPYSTYYFDTSLLLFYIRISLFRFSKELTEIFDKDKKDKQWRESLQKLREQFSKFTILYQFPLVSNQQQSIEMLQLNRKHFDIDNFFREIQQEIDKTHDFLESVQANKLGESANKLARWGIPIAAGGLLAGIFGMNELPSFNCLENNCISWLKLLVETAVIIIVLFVIVYFQQKEDRK